MLKKVYLSLIVILAILLVGQILFLFSENRKSIDAMDVEFGNKYSVRYLIKAFAFSEEAYAKYLKAKSTQNEEFLYQSIDSIDISLSFLNVSYSKNITCIEDVEKRLDDMAHLLESGSEEVVFSQAVDESFFALVHEAKICINEAEVATWSLIAQGLEIAKKKVREFQYVLVSVNFLTLLVLGIIFYLYISKMHSEKRLQESEKRLREMNDTLHNLVESEVSKRMEHQKVLIQQSKMASMGEMVGAITHQWKQPVNTLSLLVDSLEDYIESSNQYTQELKQLQDDMVRQVEFLSQTITDFRNFFRPDREKQEFELGSAIDDIYRLLRSQIVQNSIVFSVLGDTKSTIFGYQNELKQVLLSLINNAKDATLQNRAKERKIEIEVKEAKEGHRIFVRDNGGGIDGAYLEKLFSKYFTTKGEKGSGIGLPICKLIIEESFDGSIDIRNIQDGAEIEIFIPKIDSEA